MFISWWSFGKNTELHRLVAAKGEQWECDSFGPWSPPWQMAWRSGFAVPGWSASTPRWPERCLGGGPENLRGWPPRGPCHGSRSDGAGTASASTQTCVSSFQSRLKSLYVRQSAAVQRHEVCLLAGAIVCVEMQQQIIIHLVRANDARKGCSGFWPSFVTSVFCYWCRKASLALNEKVQDDFEVKYDKTWKF